MIDVGGQLREPGLVLMELGERPVGRVEYLSPDQARAVEEFLRERFDARLHIHAERDESGRLDLFYGFDEGPIREVVALVAAVDEDGQDREEMLAKSAEIGRLLGYPSCCAEAFARLSFFELRYNEWAHLRLRCESPGPLPPELNPFEGLTIGHLPCAADCPETLRQAELVRAHLAEKAPERLEALLERASKPVAFLLDVFGSYVVLAQAPGDDGGPCELLYRVGPDSRLEAFAAGDRIGLAPGLLTVEHGETRVATFPMSCGLWSHERAWQPEWWAAAARAGHLVEDGDEGLLGNTDPNALPRMLRNAMRVVEAYADTIAQRTGFHHVDFSAAADELHVTFRAGSDRVTLVVCLADESRRLAASGRYVSIGVVGRADLDESNVGRLILFVHRLLEAVMARREG